MKNVQKPVELVDNALYDFMLNDSEEGEREVGSDGRRRSRCPQADIKCKGAMPRWGWTRAVTTRRHVQRDDCPT